MQRQLATNGTEQLRFLEELASLLRPETPLKRQKMRPAPPAKHTRSEKSREIRRKTNGRTGSGDSDVSIDPRDFLNSAELALLHQRKRTPHTKKLETEPPPLPETDKGGRSTPGQRKRDSHAHSLDQPSSSRKTRNRSTSLSGYWLRESREPDIQHWLRQKEREGAARRLAEKRERRQEKKKREEKARLQQEREQLAKVAYQQWKERKKSEEKAKKKRHNHVSTKGQQSTSKLSKISHKLS